MPKLEANQVNEMLERLLQRHEELVTASALEALGIDPGTLIDAASLLLHKPKTGEPVIHQLCEEGLAILVKLILVVGAEAGIRSCSGFRKPN